VSSVADLVDGARRQLELDRARRDERRDAQRWARDPLGWIDKHVVITSFLPSQGFDRQQIRPVRMRLFPSQQETIAAWIDLELLATTGTLRFVANLAIEKSRQIGETWLFAALVAWLVHHHPVTGLCMHVDLAEIDDGGAANTWKSLFGKVRFIDRHLDRTTVAYPELVFKQKPSKIENPELGAVVYGEGQSDDPGRGQSLDFAVVDEAARVFHGELVHASLSDACPIGKAYLSTPKGEGTMHARLCDEKPRGWRYLRLHWSNHPVYGRDAHVAGEADGCALCDGNRRGVAWVAENPRAHRYPGRITSSWYDAAVIEKTDEQVASELDIDRQRSLTGRVFPEFSGSVHVVETGIEYDPALKVELAWDFGLDATSVPVIQQAPEEVRVIGLLEMGDLHGSTETAIPERVAHQLRLYLQELGLPEVETRPEFTRFWRCVGDPSGHARTLESGRPYVQQYRRQGFNIAKPPGRLTQRIDFSLLAVQRLLVGTPKRLRVCGVNASEFGKHMAANRYRTDAQGVPTRPRSLDDDVHNHPMRAFAYWAVATFPPPAQEGANPSPGPAHELEPVPPEDPLERRRRRAPARARDRARGTAGFSDGLDEPELGYGTEG